MSVETIGSELDLTNFDAASAQSLSEMRVQRIVISLASRTDADIETVDRIATFAGEIPIAVATENWLDGSRRTGWGETTFSQMPWYRWWDGWEPWLRGAAAKQFGECVPAAEHLMHSENFLEPDFRAAGGYVVADCPQTAQGWCQVAQAAGWTCKHIFSRDLTNTLAKLGSTSCPPRWVLIDDTADVARAHELMGPLESMDECQTALPEAIVIYATTMPRAALWKAIVKRDRFDAICKPSTGSSLVRGVKHFLESND